MKLFTITTVPLYIKNINWNIRLSPFITGFCCLVMGLISSNLSYAQCKTGCTSNDIQIKQAYLVDANKNPIDLNCNSGENITAYLALDLTTNTPRFGVSITGKVVIKGTETTVTGGNVGECFSKQLTSTTTNPTTQVIFTNSIQWTCGTEIVLKNVFIAWGTGNTNFCTGTAAQCPATPSKCWSQPPSEYIPIVTYPCTPASISTQPTAQIKCDGETATFTVAYTGGTPEPTVTWQRSTDGVTYSNFAIAAPYSVTTVTNTSPKTTTLTIDPAGTAQNYYYRAVLDNSTTTNTCRVTSNGAQLTVNTRPSNPVVSETQPTCSSSNGSITVTSPLDGNNIDYEYKLGSGSWVDDITFTVAANTSYTLSVRNKSSQCEANATATGTMGAQPAGAGTIQMNVTQPTCTNSNGTVTVTSPVDGNNIDYDYSADNGANYQEGTSFTVAANSSYSIIARRKSSGCTTAAATGTMGAQPASPSKPTVCKVEPSLCGPAKGMISITAGGSGSLYSIDNGTTWCTNNVFSNLDAGGTYIMKVKNTDGCVSPATTCAEATICTSILTQQSLNCPSTNALGSNSARQQTYDVAIELDPATKVSAVPNPFNDKIRFSVKSSISGQGSLELFNTMGQKVKTVFQGYVTAGQVQNIEYYVPGAQRTNLIYIFRVGSEKTSGKLMNLKQ